MITFHAARIRDLIIIKMLESDLTMKFILYKNLNLSQGHWTPSLGINFISPPLVTG